MRTIERGCMFGRDVSMRYVRTFWQLGTDDPVNALMRWPVATVECTDQLPEVSWVLAENEVGAVVVVRGLAVIGIVSERDVAARLATELDPVHLIAGDVMSAEWLSVTPETSILEAGRIMRECHVRHLPVVSGDLVTGMVSMRDVFDVLMSQAESHRR